MDYYYYYGLIEKTTIDIPLLNKSYKEVLEAIETLKNALYKWDKINNGRFIKTIDFSFFLNFMKTHFKHIEDKGIFRNKKANSKYPEKLFIYSISVRDSGLFER